MCQPILNMRAIARVFQCLRRFSLATHPWKQRAACVTSACVLLLVNIFAGLSARGDETGLLPTPLRVRRWRADSGLPLSHVPMIAQSDLGYLWLAAPHEGLCRFDGTSFTTPGDDPGTQWTFSGGKDPTALYSGSDGSLYVGTGDGLWQLKNNQWTHFTTDQGLSNNEITAIEEGSDQDLWVGTADGVNRLRGGSVRVYRVPSGSKSHRICVIRHDRQGVVWVGTRGGELYWMHDEHPVIVPWPQTDAHNRINAILAARDGSVWIGSSNAGLCRWNAGVFEPADPRFSGVEIFSLAEDRWGSIWIGSRKGLLVLPSKAAGGGRVQSVSRGSTFALLRDREGTIWAGTHTGLDQYKDWRLRVYGEAQGLPDQNISSTFAAREGGLWVGTNGGGLARFRDGKTEETYGIQQGLQSNDVTAVCEARDGTVWIGSWGEGLYRLKNTKITRVDVGDRLRSGIVRSIFEDRAGDIWVGSWGNGLLRFQNDNVRSFTRRDGLVNDQVRVIEEDAAGHLWIATHGGLSRFRDGQWQSFTQADGLSENSIFALRADVDGSLWVGTWGGGLNRIRQGRVTSYTARDGLPCDTICEILDDQHGNLWMSSVKGIIRARKVDFDAIDRGAARTLSATLYDRDDGMRSAQCNRGTQPSGCRTADGSLWFATIDGIVKVDPMSLPANHVVPTAILDQVLCDRAPVAATGLLELPAARREFEFRYSAPCLLAAEKVRFRYKLDGYNVEWIEAGTRREVHYSNLPPGAFKFLVAACNSDGVWGPVSELLQLAIVPPLHRTPEFWAACGIVAAVTLAVAHRLWLARLRARERELVVLVDRRTAEARSAQAAAEGANRAKNRFLAVLRHELRTPLTPVLLSVDCLLQDEPAPEAREQLEMIRRNIELEARLVDDLLDVSRIECDRLKLELEIVDVHQAIARAIEVCSEDVRTSGLRVVMRLRALAHHAHADQARLIQVFWNLIRNAARFALPGGTLTISTRNEKPATTENGEPRLIVEFQDSGMGIDSEMLEKIFEPFEQGSVELRERRGGLGLGLAISRAVAQAHGGRLAADSAGRNRGSTFVLELTAIAAPAIKARESAGPDPIRHRSDPLTILLVEDNADTLRYLGAVLKRQGYRVTPASSLTAARQAARDAEFELLISDIELPDGSGLELMRDLRPRGIRGIALSGYGSADDIKNSLAAGFSLHLVKPVLAEVVDDAISRLASGEHSRPRDPVGAAS
jgi:ligand-binding sensor domain-containing protein/signal transduction histidine kinase/CheY-like chemotaxis protein